LQPGFQIQAPQPTISIYSSQDNFVWDRSVIKGTLLGEQTTFSAVSRLSFEGFS